MRSCPRCTLVNPDSALVCDCGYPLNVDASTVASVWPRERIIQIRGRGITAAIFGLAFLYLTFAQLRGAERHEREEVRFYVHFSGSAPVLLLFGVLLTVFPHRAATALDRRAGTKPVVWLGAFVLLTIGIVFTIWVERKFEAYGYARPRPPPLQEVEPKYEGL
jgi:hypothetical protein